MNIFTHRVGRNAVALGIIQISNYALPLLLLPYLARVLGMETFGVVAFGMSILQVAYVFTDFGFSLSATEDISVNRDDKHYVEETLSLIFIVKLFLFALVAILLIVVVFFTQKFASHKIFLILTLLPIFGQTFQPIWFFQGIEKMRYVTIYTVCARVIYFVSIFLFVNTNGDYVLVPILNGVAQITASIVAICLIYKLGYKFSRPPIDRIVTVCCRSSHYFLSRVSVAVYTSGSVFFLGVFGSLEQVAIYSIAEQVYRGLQGFYMPINAALYPYMAREKNYGLYFKVVSYVFGIAVVAVFLGSFVKDYFVIILFGNDFILSSNIIQVFFIILLINILGVFLGYGFLSSFGKTNVANNTVILGSIVHIVILVILGVGSGLNASVIVFVVLFTETFVLIFRAFYSYTNFCNYRRDS